MPKVITHSPKETKELGKSLAVFLKAGDIISFTGDLGAGKTTFIQGLARGLGITQQVTSPTFTLIKEYHPEKQSGVRSQESGVRTKKQKRTANGEWRTANKGLSLYHFDCYRLSSFQELYDLGYEEYFFSQGVVAIEWGDKISPLLPANYLKIALKLSSERIREIEIIPHGSRAKNLSSRWLSKGEG